jgi:hypothetical protein
MELITTRLRDRLLTRREEQSGVARFFRAVLATLAAGVVAKLVGFGLWPIWNFALTAAIVFIVGSVIAAIFDEVRSRID